MSSNEKSIFSEALIYHSQGRPGKTQVRPTKPTATQHDLSLAYTPGVAEPCRAIAKDPNDAFLYTNRGNLVAVVSNGTAVLGLGDIGPLAGKPVMEGKAVLFKRFADIDVFDLELATADPNEVIRTCEILEPTFGGINLEDIKAPECFVIEKALKEKLDIPVFHDDQHGTAIIAGAGFINAVQITGRDISKTRVVVSGAGAAGIACAHFLIELGVDAKNLLLCDSRGVVYAGRTDGMNSYKAALAQPSDCRTLADALDGADAFVGVSVANTVTAAMIMKMADRPIIFALANPDPEIPYDVAKQARPDAIVATGRSDFPNQVNNVLGFPFIFRGALDVQARQVTPGMKIAAAHALAHLAQQEVPDSVLRAYQVDALQFGSDYIIPKPFDSRVLWHVAPAVAKAATDDGVARRPLADVASYAETLRARFQSSYGIMHAITNRARAEAQHVVYPHGEDIRVIRAARRVYDEQIARPVLLGNVQAIQAIAEEHNIPLEHLRLADPTERNEKREAYAKALFEIRQRRGMTLSDARLALDDANMFGAMMIQQGDADALLGGLTTYYAATIRPAIQTLALEPGRTIVSATYIVFVGERFYFLADCAVNPEPNAEQLAEIAISTADLAERFNTEARVAMLSYSNFGSAQGPEVERVRKAVGLAKRLRPGLQIDGEMHADTAVVGDLLRTRHPFSDLKQSANVLVFPNLTAANAAYKLLHHLAGAEVIGPIITGLSRSVQVIQRDAEVGDIVNLTAIAALEAIEKKRGQ